MTAHIGDVLAELRNLFELTQDEVGEKFGRTKSSVSSIEQPGSNPRWASVVAIKEALGVGFLELALLLDDVAPDARTALALADQIRKGDLTAPSAPALSPEIVENIRDASLSLAKLASSVEKEI